MAFEFVVKAKDPVGKLWRAKNTTPEVLKSKGIKSVKIEGDAMHGKIALQHSAGSIEGEYSVTGNEVKLKITKNPMGSGGRIIAAFTEFLQSE
jgi:hypothetical protein